jgi:hypothetical protein
MLLHRFWLAIAVEYERAAQMWSLRRRRPERSPLARDGRGPASSSSTA